MIFVGEFHRQEDVVVHKAREGFLKINGLGLIAGRVNIGYVAADGLLPKTEAGLRGFCYKRRSIGKK